ncbi:hypothetical protein MRX96_019405 [Rhipicephalus microplus]
MKVSYDGQPSRICPYAVVDFFKRIEFQQRGSAHIHTTLWLGNAPNEEFCSDMPKTLEMVNSCSTCVLGTSRLKRPRTQVDTHIHTCYKHDRTKCKSSASFTPSAETRIVVPFPCSLTRRPTLSDANGSA